jgi:hypothetical protein
MELSEPEDSQLGAFASKFSGIPFVGPLPKSISLDLNEEDVKVRSVRNVKVEKVFFDTSQS